MIWSKARLERFFQQLGCPFQVADGDTTYWGVFSPALAEDSGKIVADPLGVGVQGAVRLMASADVPGLVKGASLSRGKQLFYVESAEVYPLYGKPFCIRASLRMEPPSGEPEGGGGGNSNDGKEVAL